MSHTNCPEYYSHINDDIYSPLKLQYSFEIKTQHATLPIYKSITKYHRDCTDVAVKIALGLETHKSENLDLNKISQHEVIKLLSNQFAISEFANEKLPIRIKQTTSIETVKVFNEIEEINFNTLKALRKLGIDKDKVKFNKMIQDHETILSSNYYPNHKPILKKLLELNQEWINLYKTVTEDTYNSLNTPNTQLSGIINLNEDEL